MPVPVFAPVRNHETGHNYRPINIQLNRSNSPADSSPGLHVSDTVFRNGEPPCSVDLQFSQPSVPLQFFLPSRRMTLLPAGSRALVISPELFLFNPPALKIGLLPSSIIRSCWAIIFGPRPIGLSNCRRTMLP